MLLHVKVYLIASLYFFGVLFMLFFPPRNYKHSGAKLRTKRGVTANYSHYLSYNELIRKAQKLVRDGPETASLVHLQPTTANNRSIVALQLHSDKNSKKPGILIVGALDAMVWGAPNAIMDLAEKLLYDSNYQVPFFNDYDWYLIPMGNPDGIHYTQSHRYKPQYNVTVWCKNSSIFEVYRPTEWHKNIENSTEGQLCFGTHINRNFAYHWQDDVHKTPEKCSQFYPGERPFSTAEARAIREYMDKLGSAIQFAVHLHASFVPKKELLLYPWRYTKKQMSNFEILQDIGEYAARQSKLPNGRLYEVHQSSSDAEGQVAGTLTDYISGVVGTDLVYVLKPYHELYPNMSDLTVLETYKKKAISTILSLVRGWRSSDKQNTLSFFGNIIEF